MCVHSSVCVDYNGKTSFEWPTLRGLRQGGILSAHLFTIYVDEFLTEVHNMPYACKLGITKVNVLAYAAILLCCLLRVVVFRRFAKR